MNIRCEIPSDYQAINEVNRLAFAGENEVKIIEAIRHSDFYIPALSLVAEVNNQIVGHIILSYIHLIGEEQLKVLALAPLAVHPQFQKQGIGSKLVTVALTKAAETQEALVIVLGHPDFYQRFGFEPSVNYGIESPFPVAQEFFMVKPLKKYDQNYRGKVVYPPAFSQDGEF
ncbi:GNAT family N-acetyltransferase [Nostoc sp. CMAA1605]|uniref:GNAT family N-acetyltransferase n=1 Tax=Nostoc sp. CMAA1605 TaxID=2055159 RepID=UPI001F44451E|nr:N-acetyltransferase [Nostoc sp. CMAA1605]MCF4968159.1 GNAT family N-acetyltransferase [Nostoc sp. CMAA1605]